MTKWILFCMWVVSACSKPGKGPETIPALEEYLKARYPNLTTVELKYGNAEGLRKCVPPLDRLKTMLPETFNQLKGIKITLDVGDWPSSTAVAWYDRPNHTIILRSNKWDSPDEGDRCQDTITHEFGHHLEQAIGEKEPVKMKAFLVENYPLGKELGSYAASSMQESWAVSFEDYVLKGQMGWKSYTKKQAEFLKGVK